MIRIGHGYDVHRLVEGRRLILGGVEIPHTHGLLGHSDADVLTHAVMDALLGAAALGDIGAQFPDTDAAYAGADSIELLKKVMALLTSKGYRVVNLDSTVIAQAPKLKESIDRMRERLAEACGILPEFVSVKATTEEGLGFSGRKEGIAAHAVVLIDEILR
jgi:2-C-methyl-D-erythritol 2,4-cyclodiphosphate synthase